MTPYSRLASPALPSALKYAVIGFLGAVVIALPGDARGGLWSLGVAGDWVEDGRVATRTFASRSHAIGTSGTTGISVNVTRDLNRHVSMSGTLMYLSFGEAPFSQARFVPLAIGARYSPTAGEKRLGGPYVELSPALVWSRWNVHFYDVDQETSIRLGLIAGLGVHGKVANAVGIDVGLRYFVSGGGETQYAGPWDSQSLDGLDHAGLHFGLSYSL
jgi:hypothetical protein